MILKDSEAEVFSVSAGNGPRKFLISVQWIAFFQNASNV